MSGWRTFEIVRGHGGGWSRCLWCGERGHFREDCAREHAHGAVTRNGRCLGCEEVES